MRNLIIYLIVFLCSYASKIYAQDTFEARAKVIAQNIERITREEKADLKKGVEAVNNDLDKGVITNQQADEQKMKLAEATASRIETRVAIEEAKLTELVKEKIDGNIAKNEDSEEKRGLLNEIRKQRRNDTIQKSEKRTTSQFVYAAGVNNLVTNERLAHSDFRYWGSHFYEVGVSYNTRLMKNDNLLHLKYGLSVMYNNLRATEGRYFEENGNQTNLQSSAIHLKDSRFKNVNLVVPMYLEFDFSGNKTKNDKPFFKTHQSFRFGLGGFAGMNVKTKQILKFDDEFGNSVTQKTKGDFNTNDFVYGAGAYIGYRDTSLYVKYDLNPLFKDNAVDQNNISLGLRFDLN